MKIAVACDHGGFPLKETVLQTVRQSRHEALDLGVFSPESVDFPDYVEKAGQAVQQNQADRAILICGSGVGACIAANKMKGIYAGVCHDTYSAHQGVEHDNMNVLCLGGRIIGIEVAKEIIQAFLSAVYFDEGRYQRRFNKILAIEKKG
jgi:ribose 5-phosphate isomerase B